MQVKELIERLQKLPLDMCLYLSTDYDVNYTYMIPLQQIHTMEVSPAEFVVVLK